MRIEASPIPRMNPDVMLGLTGNTLRVLSGRKPTTAVYHGLNRCVQLTFHEVDGGFASTVGIYDSEFGSTLVVEIDGASIVLKCEIGVFFVADLPERRELSTVKRYEEMIKARREAAHVRDCAENSKYRQRPFSDDDMDYLRDKMTSARAGIRACGFDDDAVNGIYLPGLDNAIEHKDAYNIIRLSACLIHKLTIGMNAD